MNNTITAKPQPCLPFFRPKLALYHTSTKGLGSALKLELHPAHDSTDGSIMMTISNQMTIGDLKGPNPVYPRFDWENAATIKLGFNDLCQMLQVFRGETETINEGRGFYHNSPTWTTRINFRHLLEPFPGYSIEVYRSPRNGGGESARFHFLFSPYEAIGVCEAIANSMGVVAFGIPTIQAHDTSAYEAKLREARNVAAA